MNKGKIIMAATVVAGIVSVAASATACLYQLARCLKVEHKHRVFDYGKKLVAGDYDDDYSDLDDWDDDESDLDIWDDEPEDEHRPGGLDAEYDSAQAIIFNQFKKH